MRPRGLTRLADCMVKLKNKRQLILFCLVYRPSIKLGYGGTGRCFQQMQRSITGTGSSVLAFGLTLVNEAVRQINSRLLSTALRTECAPYLSSHHQQQHVESMQDSDNGITVRGQVQAFTCKSSRRARCRVSAVDCHASAGCFKCRLIH